MKLRLAILVTLYITAILLSSCAAQKVETRALSFYRMLAGQSPKDSMVNYLSPAYRAELEKQGKLEIFASLAKTLRINATKTKELNPKNIHSDRLGDFALTWVEGLPDEPMVGSPPMKWVRTRGKWYLYMGSEAELKAYKDFPSGLRPPVISPPKASETSEKPTKEEKAKGQAAKPAPEQGKTQEKPKGK
jgi:hypothetical protein